MIYRRLLLGLSEALGAIVDAWLFVSWITLRLGDCFLEARKAVTKELITKQRQARNAI